MKNLRTLALIIGIVVAGLAFTSVANAASPSEYSRNTTFKHDKHKEKHKHKADKLPKNKNKHKAEKMPKNKIKGDKMPKEKNKPAKERMS